MIERAWPKRRPALPETNTKPSLQTQYIFFYVILTVELQNSLKHLLPAKCPMTITRSAPRAMEQHYISLHIRLLKMISPFQQLTELIGSLIQSSVFVSVPA